MLDKLDQTLRFQQTALSLRGYRQEILSANIANADTPYYKARDFDFSSVLKTAMGPALGSAMTPGIARVPAPGLVRTSADHLAGTAPAAAQPASLLYRTPYQMSVDGNSVEMDAERAQFAQNAIHYEAGIGFLSGQIKSLLAVVQS
jgi:flagellar basal-body rod protein FlgB